MKLYTKQPTATPIVTVVAVHSNNDGTATWEFSGPVSVTALAQGFQIFDVFDGFVDPIGPGTNVSPTEVLFSYVNNVDYHIGNPWQTVSPLSGVSPLPLPGQVGLMI